MKVTLLQWNIWYKEDIHNVVQFLKENPADIVCLQELTFDDANQQVKDTPAFIADSLGYNYHIKRIEGVEEDGTEFYWANGVFTKFDIKHRVDAWINEPTGKGGYDDEYRAYVEAQLEINGALLSVGTTHMSYTHRFEDTERKTQESDRLLALMNKHSNNYIFSGDLNAGPGSGTISAIEKAYKNAGPDYSQNTWTTKPFAYHGFEVNNLDWRLDHVFSTKDVRVLSAGILNTDYSDHLPILVTFEI